MSDNESKCSALSLYGLFFHQYRCVLSWSLVPPSREPTQTCFISGVAGHLWSLQISLKVRGPQYCKSLEIAAFDTDDCNCRRKCWEQHALCSLPQHSNDHLKNEARKVIRPGRNKLPRRDSIEDDHVQQLLQLRPIKQAQEPPSASLIPP